MARKPRTIESEQTKIADDAITDIPFEEISDPETVAIDHAIRGFGENAASVSIYRQGPGGHRDLTFLFSTLPTEWLTHGFNRVQQEYGGGTFRIHMQDNDGLMKLNRQFKIEALPKKEEPKAAASPQSEVTAMLAALTQSMERMASAITEIRSKPADNPLNSIEAIEKIARIIRPPQEQAPRSDIMQLITAVKEINDLIKPSTPIIDENGDVSGNAVLLRGLEIFGQALMKAQGAQPVAAPGATPALPQPPASEAAPAQPEQMTEEQQEMLLKLYLKQACDRAAKNANPEETADLVYEHANEEFLLQLANEPNWFGQICAKEQACTQHQKWFTQVRNKVIEYLVEDELLPKSALSAITPVNGDIRPDSIGGGANSDAG